MTPGAEPKPEPEPTNAPPNGGGGSSSGGSGTGATNVIIMADTFPAKAHLLLKQLTESNPEIATFSPDGKSFCVLDQQTFAQTYLPQYFKHNNWGSFVRQLNLYGFTSSRDKETSDHVSWSHELFQRDRTDLLDKIKRTKKKPVTPKSANKNGSNGGNGFINGVNDNNGANGVNNVVANTGSRIQSPALSDGGYSSGVNSLDEPIPVNFSSNTPTPTPDHRMNGNIIYNGGNNMNHIGNNGISAPNPIVDHEWMTAEFSHIKQQNLLLEQKLNLLLKITLKMSKEAGVDLYSGSKRRRMNHGEGYAASSSSSPFRSGGGQGQGQWDGSNGNDMALGGGGMGNPNDLEPIREDQNMNFNEDPGEDSFKAFIDNMMFSDENHEASSSGRSTNMVPLDNSDRDGHFSNSNHGMGGNMNNNGGYGNNNNSNNISYSNTMPNYNDLNNATNNMGGGYATSSGEYNGNITMANANREKANPDAVAVIASDGPNVAKDIEAGNHPSLGVAVVPAHAVHDDGIIGHPPIIDGSGDIVAGGGMRGSAPHVIEHEDDNSQEEVRRSKNGGGDAPANKNYQTFLMAFFAALVVMVAITVPTVIAVQRKNPSTSTNNVNLNQPGIIGSTGTSGSTSSGTATSGTTKPAIKDNRPAPMPSDTNSNGNSFFGDDDQVIVPQPQTRGSLFAGDMVRGIGSSGVDLERITLELSRDNCSCYQGN